jgi:YndJ-like protein
MKSAKSTTWNRWSALAGAALWASLCFAARRAHLPFGPIELMLILALLVMVPLGLALLNRQSPAGETATLLPIVFQPIAAAFGVISFFLAPGRLAASFTLPWLALAALVALPGWRHLFSRTSLPKAAFQFARLNLMIAGAWLFASRAGWRPLGTQEPIVLLTAVHFHFTGFATAILAGTVLRSHELTPQRSRWLPASVATIIFAPYLIAAGFVLSPLLKVVGVAALSLALSIFAGVQFTDARSFLSLTARRFTRISSTFIFLGMALALTYSVGEFLQRDWLTIPRMASTHGLLNGAGFVLTGLLGWLIETEERESLRTHDTAADQLPFHSLPSADFHDCIRL